VCNSSREEVKQEQKGSHNVAVPRIYAGFAMKLNEKTRVRRKTLMEVKSFQQVCTFR